MFKTVKIEDAVGRLLAHDVTEIRPREFKGRAFKKGHRIHHQDICHFQRLGKEHIFVLDLEKGYYHENDAAVAKANACEGLLQVKPLKRARTGLVITGNEVFTHLIEDRFESILRKK